MNSREMRPRPECRTRDQGHFARLPASCLPGEAKRVSSRKRPMNRRQPGNPPPADMARYYALQRASLRMPVCGSLIPVERSGVVCLARGYPKNAIDGNPIAVERPTRCRRGSDQKTIAIHRNPFAGERSQSPCRASGQKRVYPSLQSHPDGAGHRLGAAQAASYHSPLRPDRNNPEARPLAGRRACGPPSLARLGVAQGSPC